MSRISRSSLIVAVLVALAALAAGPTACKGGGPVVIGAVLPLTGEFALYGEPIRQGIELAYEKVQADEELDFELALQIEDSASDPEQAAAAAARLYAQGAVAVIGGVTTDEALAMIESADREEKVLLSPSASSPRLTGISRNFFRVYPSDFSEGTRMGIFAAQTLGIESAVIVAAESPYARGIQDIFKTEFERYGGEVPAVIEYPPASENFEPIVAQALELRPVAVYVADYARNTARIVQALRAQDYGGKILVTSAFAAPDVLAEVGPAAEAVLVTQTAMPPNDPAVASFSQAFTAKHGHPPSIWAAHGYDALLVLVEAMREGGTRPNDVWKGMRSIRNFPGASGVIQFDERGDVSKFPRTYVVENGELVDYERTMEEKRQQILRQIEQINRSARTNPGG
jgi:branched-chain amino acid transport system substrate-binding protein